MELAATAGIRSRGITTYPSQELPTEDVLMARYAAGDDLAFQPLCTLLAPRIRAFFLRSFAEPALTDRLVQATFARLRQGRAAYRPETSFRDWVLRLAADVRRDELRRRHGLAHRETDDDAGDVDLAGLTPAPVAGAAPLTAPELAASAAPHNADAVRAAQAAFRALPEQLRVVLHLHTSERLSFEQIAELLGATPEVIRSQAQEAYGRLQDELQSFLKSTDEER